MTISESGELRELLLEPDDRARLEETLSVATMACESMADMNLRQDPRSPVGNIYQCAARNLVMFRGFLKGTIR